MFRKPPVIAEINLTLDSTAVTIFVVILVELTNTVFVNSTNITTNLVSAVLSTLHRLPMGLRLQTMCVFRKHANKDQHFKTPSYCQADYMHLCTYCDHQ